MALDPAIAYREIFATLTSSFSVRPQRADDVEFLFDLYRESERGAYARLGFDGLALLGPAMLRGQFDLRERAYRDNHPAAMAVILEDAAGAPAGRFLIDWDEDGVTHGIDLAVLPTYRQGVVGPHLLAAWIAVADRLGRASILEVMPDNPVRALYHRLGFKVREPDRAPVPMIRAPLGGRSNEIGR